MTSQPSGQMPDSSRPSTPPIQSPDSQPGSKLPETSSPSAPAQPPDSGSSTVYGPPGVELKEGKMDLRYGGLADMRGPSLKGREYGERRRLGPGGTYEEPPDDWKPSLAFEDWRIIASFYRNWMEDDTLLQQGKLPPSYMRDHLWGFDSATLTDHGIMTDPRVKPNNLENPIHPIFRQDRWKSTPPEFYRFLHPALRLASRLLTSASCSQYWITLFLGRREIDRAASVQLGVSKQRIMEDPPLTLDAYQKVQERFDFYASKTECVTFHWQGWHDDSMPRGPWDSKLFSGKIFACTDQIRHTEVIQSLLTKDWLNPEAPGKERWHCPIMLNYDFYACIGELQQSSDLDQNQLLPFYLFFATVLVHELTHAIGFLEQHPHAGAENKILLPEPLFPSDPDIHTDEYKTEVGTRWENYTWGMVMEPINGLVSGKFGLCCARWPREIHGPPKARRAKFYAIPMVWISAVQQEGNWPRDDEICPKFKKRLEIDLSQLPVGFGQQSITTTTPVPFQREMWTATTDKERQWFEGLRKDGFFGKTDDSEPTIDVVRKNIHHMDPSGKMLESFRKLPSPPEIYRMTIDSTIFPNLSPEFLKEFKEHEEDRYFQRAVILSACRLILEDERAKNLPEGPTNEKLEGIDVYRGPDW